MTRKVQAGMLRAALVALICTIGSVLGLRAETYYWTGAVDNTTGNKGNWSLTSGGPAASKIPGQGDTVVFENQEAITLKKSDPLYYLKYEFRGAAVTLSEQKKQYGYGGGGITATGSGTYTLVYPLELNANQFEGEDKTFTVDVAGGATVVFRSSGTTKIYSPAEFIKRGAGTYKTTQFLNKTVSTRGKLTFEAGTLWTDYSGVGSSDRYNYIGHFNVTGPAEKEFQVNAMSPLIVRYSETVEASQTLTFKTVNGSKNAYSIQLTGPYDVPRFSANLVAVSGCDSKLVWNPEGGTNVITMVDRVWNSSPAMMDVRGGTMRFAEGSGIKNLAGLTIASGAALEIALSASGEFSGAPIALEDGAKLKVVGALHYFQPKSISYGGMAVPDGVYSADDLAWLEGDGYLVVGSATRPAVTLFWTGAAGEASPKLSTAANWRCADGSPVSALQSTDSLVFTNEEKIATSETCMIGTGRELVKRGSGTLQVAQFLPMNVTSRGKLTFEAGTLTTVRPSVRWGYFGEFVVTGSETKQFNQGETSGEAAGAVNLSIVKYVETEDASQTMTFYNHQGNDYVVELSGAYDVPRFSANLSSSYGDNTLKWNPGDAKTITMVDRVWNSKYCKFLVSSGTMRFADGAGIANLKDFTVASGAKLAIAANAGSFGRTLNLNLETGATLVLEADKTLSALSYGGTPVPDGVYTAADLEWLDGEGHLIVGSGSPAAVPATWTGGGDQTTITDPQNWGGTLPDFSSGSLVATFPANGTVTIPSGESWKFRGIVVDPSGTTDDTLTIAGEGEMWVGADGLVSRGASGVTIGVKTAIVSSNPWTFGSAVGGGSLVFGPSAEVVTIGDAVWTVNAGIESYGAGSAGPFLKLQCSNPNLGNSSFMMPVQVSADEALGGADSVATIDCLSKAGLALELTRCHLLNRQIVLKNVQATDYLRALKSTGFVEIEGELYFDALNDYYWFSSFPTVDTDVLTIRGGWRVKASTNQLRTGQPFNTGYKVLVENGMVANKFWLSTRGWFYMTGEIDVSGGFFIADGAFLRLNEGASFRRGTDANSVAGIGFTGTEGTGTLDLQGHDATVQILAGEGAGVVASEDAATLTLNADREFVTPSPRGWESAPTFSTKIGSGTSAPDREEDIKDIQQTDHVSFRGCANLVKTGQLPHWTGGVSTSTGTVAVAGGVLTFKDGASWRTATSVTVSGTGVLGIEGNRTFSGKTDLVVTGGTADRIRIAAGKKLIVKSLTVNGEPLTSVPAGLVTGGGDLQIGPDGLILVVR